MQYKALSIAGFDGSGGAGIQADLKTFAALGCYGMTVLTALPIQNTCGVKTCYEIPLAAIQDQLETLFEDIRPQSIKIGMLFSEPIIQCVARFLKPWADKIPIVLDPVMIAKSGSPLLNPAALNALKTQLLPLATIVTPNLPEAYALVGKITNPENLVKEILNLGSQAILLKGGHDLSLESNDLFFDQQGPRHWLKANRIISQNTHGTGCTLSAAIAAFLAKKYTLLDACQQAKNYVHQAILAAKHNSVGQGQGPVHHFYHWWR